MKTLKSQSANFEKTLIRTIDKEVFNIVQITFNIISPIVADKPFYDATMGPFQRFDVGILELKDDEGFTGECEFPVCMASLLKNVFVPIILETKEVPYSELFEKLFWSIRNDGFRGASALALGNLDRVFYDLAAKRENLPLYKFLGSHRPYVNAYASGGGVNFEGSELLDECLRWENEGYSTIKIKFGGLKTSIKEDINRISFIREALNPKTKLAVDANQSMSLQKSMKFVKELEAFDIAWLEEPIHSAALDEIEELCSTTTLPISFGESERSAKVFPSIIRARVKHLQPIVGHIGCFKDWLLIAKLAAKESLDFSSGGSSHFNSQFVSVVKGAQLEYLEPIFGPMSHIFLEKPTVRNGQFIFSDLPGCGTLIDWGRLKREKKIVGTKTWK